MGSRVLLAWLGLAAGAATVEANATIPGLRWSAGETCPDEAGFLVRVERHLGRPLSQADLSTAIEVAVVADGARWRARVVPSGEGAREIQGASCEDVTEAAALFVALFVGPEATPPVSTVEALAPAARVEEPAWHGWLQLHTGADWGDLPSLTPTLGLGAVAELGRARFALAGTFSWASTQVDERRARFNLFVIGGSACWDGRFAWLCGGVEGGVLSASGFGFAGAQEGSSPWGALSAGLERGVPLSRRIRLEIRAEVVVPLVPARFTFGGDMVHETPPAAGRLRIGVEMRFF